MVRLIYILMLLFLTGCFISNFPTKCQSLGFVHNPRADLRLFRLYIAFTTAIKKLSLLQLRENR